MGNPLSRRNFRNRNSNNQPSNTNSSESNRNHLERTRPAESNSTRAQQQNLQEPEQVHSASVPILSPVSEPASGLSSIMEQQESVSNFSSSEDRSSSLQIPGLVSSSSEVPTSENVNSNSGSTNQEIVINILPMGGCPMFQIQIARSATVLVLKNKIKQKIQLPVIKQRLLLGGAVLADNHSLYNLDNSTIQLIPFGIKPNLHNRDETQKDVDREIQQQQDPEMQNAFDDLQNFPISLQCFLIDVMRRSMNRWEEDVCTVLEKPIVPDRFADPWEIKIEDLRSAVQGSKIISDLHVNELLQNCVNALSNPEGVDFIKLGRICSQYGNIISSLSRLCCRVHVDEQNGDLELRRGVNIEQVMVIQNFGIISRGNDVDEDSF